MYSSVKSTKNHQQLFATKSVLPSKKQNKNYPVTGNLTATICHCYSNRKTESQIISSPFRIFLISSQTDIWSQTCKFFLLKSATPQKYIRRIPCSLRNSVLQTQLFGKYFWTSDFDLLKSWMSYVQQRLLFTSLCGFEEKAALINFVYVFI